MPKQRSLEARLRTKPQLGDSWVVESDGDDDDDGDESNNQALRPSQQSSRSPETPRKRTSRTSTRASVEPDLIMPSINENDLDGSWPDAKMKRSQRLESIHGKSSPGKATRRQSTVETASKDAGAKSKTPKKSTSSTTTWETVEDLLKATLGWIYDVVGGALVKLKGPISYLLAIYLLIGIMMFLRNLLFSSVYSAMSPLCKIPGSSFLNLPMCHSGVSSQYLGDQPPPVQFDELMTVQSKFEDVLEASAGGVSLPLDMKRGESSIRDLRTVVRHSALRSKNELVLEFDGFIETARIASYDLQKFNSHIGRAVDSLLATNRWTKRVLDDISVRDASKGAIASFFSSDNSLFAPFQPLKFTEDALLDQYIQHTRVAEEEIQRLVAEAQSLLFILNNLEDRLDLIHSIATRDNLHTETSRSEILSHLWTKLGGNAQKMAKFDTELRLLSQVNVYRKNAIAQVSGTMLKLQKMGAELEELRTRVGGVEVLGGRMGVPLEVHIESIELGIERLEEGRERAKRLERGDLMREREGGGGRGIEG